MNEWRQPAGTSTNERGWGDRMHGGAVTGGSRDGHVWVNASLLGVGVTARISPEAAEDLADQLRQWAAQARSQRRG